MPISGVVIGGGGESLGNDEQAESGNEDLDVDGTDEDEDEEVEEEVGAAAEESEGEGGETVMETSGGVRD